MVIGQEVAVRRKDDTGARAARAAIGPDGGDVGGLIIPTSLGAQTAYQTFWTQSGDANGGLGPALRH